MSINSAGAQLSITIGDSADTSGDPVEYITDESGNPITSEDGEYLTTERANDLVGSESEDALIRNDNLVKVYEVSDNYPNGLLVFSGYISKWKALFGGQDTVEITVLSEGQDLNQWVIPGGSAYTIDVDQSSKNSDIGFWATRRYGQTFITGASETNIGKIRLRMSRQTAGDRTVTLKLWASTVSAVIGGTPLGSASVVLTNVYPSWEDIDFIFSTPVIVTPSTPYFFSVEVDSGSISGDVTTWVAFEESTANPYSNGELYSSNSGAAWSATSTDDFYFKTYSFVDSIERLYVDRDPTYIIEDIMANYGGVVTPSGAFTNTGTTIPSYTFKMNTVLEGIRAVSDMAPADWYWFVDPSDNTLYWDQTSATADILIVKGRHINSFDVEATKETVVNKVYYSGGDDGGGSNVFVVVANEDSDDRLGIARLSDTNVNGVDGASTATILAQNYIDRNSSQTYKSSLTLEDTKIDTNQFKVGTMIGFSGFGNFADNLLLQVVGIDKRSDSVTLQLGTLPVRQSDKVEKIQSSLTAVQVSDNPNIPS